MKKIILSLLIIISLNAVAQKDTVPQMDTVYVLTTEDATFLKQLFYESKVVVNGEQLSGKQLQSLMIWIDQRARIFKKEQPKK